MKLQYLQSRENTCRKIIFTLKHLAVDRLKFVTDFVVDFVLKYDSLFFLNFKVYI